MTDHNKKRFSFRRECPRAKLQATNWLAGISDARDFDIVEVIFKNTRTGYYINGLGPEVKIGDTVVVESQPGYDIGRVNMTGRLVKLQMRKNGIKEDSELRKLLRYPTPQELDRADEAHSLEHETMIKARRIAEGLSLNMKIGDVEYQADAAKAIFYYIADERVDFRALIRVLADTFKVRVEMRQIGARQEAGRIGGIGPCGRPLCCSQWITRFSSVGTGAARIQDISMSPQKLAGQCAKLKCCLNFESAIYAEAQKQMPGKDVQLETKDATYYLFKSDILAHKVTYSTDRKIPANLVTIDSSRAFEIIALNKQGVRVDSLLPEEEAAQGEETPTDLVEQESLTRFDGSKSKKRKNRGRRDKSQGEKKQQGENRPQGEKKQQGENRPQGEKKPQEEGRHQHQRRRQRGRGGEQRGGEQKKSES